MVKGCNTHTHTSQGLPPGDYTQATRQAGLHKPRRGVVMRSAEASNAN